MRFKYQEAFDALDCQCPEDHCAQLEAAAVLFRFVHDDVPQARSFLPNAVCDPKRKFKDDRDTCENYALSLFGTASQARTAHQGLVARHPKIGKKIGDRLASVEILPDDGVLSPSDPEGHRDLYEAANANIYPRARSAGVLS